MPEIPGGSCNQNYFGLERLRNSNLGLESPKLEEARRDYFNSITLN